MKNIQIKKPYVAPELTVVDFRVERGMNASVPVKAELDLMQIGYIQNEGNQSNLYAGDPMSDLGTGGYFGAGDYGTLSIPAPSYGGYFTGGGGYF